MTSEDLCYLQALTILYVEDCEIIREQMSDFLRRRCAVLLLAADGQQGLELFHQYQPDLVITDILMPVMDGLKMSEAIRTTHPKTPIIITTAFEEPRYLQKAIDIDVDKYVIKPIDLEILEAALLKCARAIRAEAALRQLHERSQELAEAQHIAKLGHWRLDLASQKLTWSDEIFNIFETDKKQFGNHYAAFLGIVHPDDREQVDRAYQAHLEHNIAYDFEHRILLADGRIKYVHERCQTERDASGKPLCSLGTLQDITERKQVEFELESYRHHLEELVAVRTSELEKAKDDAEAASRAKSVFLANMSHELRTPLNAILGFAQLLERDKCLNDEQRGQLQTINRAGQHLLSLINDVLEISRIEAGRVILQHDTFDLGQMLVAIEEIIHLRAEAKGLEFKLERVGVLPRYVHGDVHHLRQVLINLLGNAVKYTDQGHVILRLTARDEAISFEVEDTGCGIAIEDQAMIFQAFYQTEQGIAKGEGTGLGLTISKEFVHVMGGDLTFTSQLGQGTRFMFTLSLPACDETEIMPQTGRILGLKLGRTLKVMVAEDNPDSRELIHHILKTEGFDVFTVSNGQQAVEAFSIWHPDFIWMDMRMPVLDGYEATRQIRAKPGGDKVKIAALTASVFQEDQEGIFAAGCDAVLAKPLDESKLFEIMGSLLELEYCYDIVDSVSSSAARHDGALDLSGLDENLRSQLQTAAELLDIETIKAIAEQLHETLPLQAELINKLLAEFQFQQIERAAKLDHTPAS